LYWVVTFAPLGATVVSFSVLLRKGDFIVAELVDLSLYDDITGTFDVTQWQDAQQNFCCSIAFELSS